MDKPATEKQIRYVADLAERLGKRFQATDWSGKPCIVSRAQWEKWAPGNITHAWVEERVPKLKAELASRQAGGGVEPASAKQIAWGKRLEKMKTGVVSFDWDNASKTSAWSRIQFLQNAGESYVK